LLTDDCVLEVAGAYVDRGRQAIRERQEQRAKAASAPASIHVVANTYGDVQDDAADVFSTFVFLEKTPEGPVVRMIGRYEDRVVRTPAGWRIAKRLITPVL
jgi:hypothetical protein